MSKVYHSVPLDEESLDGTGEKLTRMVRTDSGLFAAAKESIGKHWIWLGHALLLSVSMTLFTLSFCMRNAKPTDRTYTELYSSYCMLLFARLLEMPLL